MQITTTSHHEEQEYGTVDVASARGILWECAQDIEGASKDADGFHLPLENGDGVHITIRIADRSNRGWQGYKYGLIVYPHTGDRMPIDDHRSDRDRPCFYETRGSFDIDRLKEALGDAIKWGRRQFS
jgi:hypothetical protein